MVAASFGFCAHLHDRSESKVDLSAISDRVVAPTNLDMDRYVCEMRYRRGYRGIIPSLVQSKRISQYFRVLRRKLKKTRRKGEDK